MSEIAACPRDWRMGSYQAVMDRDNITRTGAKDPWGREANASPTAARGCTGDLDSEPGKLSASEADEGRRQTDRLRGNAGSRLNRDAVPEGAV